MTGGNAASGPAMRPSHPTGLAIVVHLADFTGCHPARAIRFD
jgi:hypothetical protein